MKIVVNDQVHLSEIRPSDKCAAVEHLNDRDIYDRLEHRMKVSLVLLVAMSVLVFADDDNAPSKFKVTTKKKDDSVEVRANKEKTVFFVKSPCLLYTSDAADE